VDRDDKIAHIFDAETGCELRRLVGHQDSMLSVVFSPDRKTIATASRDNTLTIWDCTVGHELCSCRHPGVVTACDFSYDGKHIYTGCQDNLVRKLLTSKGRCQRLMDRLPQTQLGVIVALGAQQQMDRKVIMSRSCDKCAHVLDADKLTVQGSLLGHSGMVWHCSFNHDDSLMVTQCDKFIKLWSAMDNSPRFSIASAMMPGPKKPPPRRSRLWTTVAFGPSEFNNVIIAAANDSMVYVLRIDTGDVLVAIEAKSSVYALAVGGVRQSVLFGDDVGNMFELQLH
jgi:WD40 repeat protein